MLVKLLSLILLLNTLIKPIDVSSDKDNLYAFADGLYPAYKELGFERLEFDIGFSNLGSSDGATYVPIFQYNKYCGTEIKLHQKHKTDPSIDMLVALAHEVGHSYQGVSCQSKTVEAGATLLSLKVLSLMDDKIYKQVFYNYLRQLLIWRLMYEACQMEVQDHYADFGVSCAEAYNRREYTKAIDWILTSDTVKASSLPVSIDVEGILEIEK